MQTNFRDVVDFQRKFEIPMPESPTLVDMDMGQFRLRFLTEELDETVSCHLAKDMPGFFDGLLDLYYVVAGTAAIFGFPYEQHFFQFAKNRLESLPHSPGFVTGTTAEYSWAWIYARAKYRDVPKEPRWPHELSMGRILEKLSKLIDDVGDAYLEEDLDRMAWNLAELGFYTMVVSAVCGLPWEEGWNEVQTKNMSKVRALRHEDSKRGSTYDVVKPEGWTPPDIAAILRRRGWHE